ncbi:unnamed protein product [Ixodes persulcatus]
MGWAGGALLHFCPHNLVDASCLGASGTPVIFLCTFDLFLLPGLRVFELSERREFRTKRNARNKYRKSLCRVNFMSIKSSPCCSIVRNVHFTVLQNPEWKPVESRRIHFADFRRREIAFGFSL